MSLDLRRKEVVHGAVVHRERLAERLDGVTPDQWPVEGGQAVEELERETRNGHPLVRDHIPGDREPALVHARVRREQRRPALPVPCGRRSTRRPP
jgi:hypothetical protein